MDEQFYDDAIEVLETIITALGAGVGVWGTINLIDAYQTEADKAEIIAEYHSRIHEIDRLVAQLYEDNKNGKISNSRYCKLTAAYEAEQAELIEAVYNFDKEVTAQKEQAVTQILKGGQIAMIAPLARHLDSLIIPTAAPDGDAAAE